MAQTIVLMTKTFGWQGSHYWWLSVAKLERGRSMRLVRVIRWPGMWQEIADLQDSRNSYMPVDM